MLVKVAYHILPALVYFFPNYAKNYLVFENLKKEIKSKNIYAKLVPIELDLKMTIGWEIATHAMLLLSQKPRLRKITERSTLMVNIQLLKIINACIVY